jgi:thioredoxin-related protein
MNIDRVLERVSNAVIIVLAIVIICRVGWTWLQTSHSEERAKAYRNSSMANTSPLRGRSVSKLRPQVDEGGVILFVSSTCRFCEENSAFHGKLSNELQKGELSMLVAVTDARTAADSRDYIREKKLMGASVIPAREVAGLGLRGTPAISLYDKEGNITQAWLGRLNSRQQSEVEVAVGNVLALVPEQTGKGG